jgi:K+-transporting ATPase ATPase C chain
MRNGNTALNESNTPAGPGFPSELAGAIKISVIATIVLAIIVSAIYPAIVWGIGQVLFPAKANGSLIGKDGREVAKDTDAVGSAWIGQPFSAVQYFHPRPSAAGNGYDSTQSGGSNLGPTSAKLINGTIKATTQPATRPSDPPVAGPDAVDFDGVRDRIVHYCQDNSIAYEPADALKPFLDAQGNVDDVKLIKAFNSDAPPAFTPGIESPADAVTASGSGLDPHVSVANAQLQISRVARARNIPVEKVQDLVARFTEEPTLGIFGDAGVNVLRLNLALDGAYPMPAAPTTQPAMH